MIKKIYKQLLPLRARNQIRLSAQRLLLPFFSGNTFKCNCCNKSYKRFLDKGNTVKRPNAQCPNCASLERTRVLQFYIKNETDIFTKPVRLLHFAPEKSLFNILSKLNIEYIDCDIDPNLARNVVDITNIQYPDRYFDFIICSHVLGHVKDEPKAIQELNRVLKSDGTAFLMTRINFDAEETFEDESIVSDADRLLHYGETDAWRFHGRDFQQRLEKQGFFVECIDYRNIMGPEVSKKYSLGDGTRELIFRCSKK